MFAPVVKGEMIKIFFEVSPLMLTNFVGCDSFQVLDPKIVKGPWTTEEDAIVIDLVDRHGHTKWKLISDALPGRNGKQCRERLKKKKKKTQHLLSFLLFSFISLKLSDPLSLSRWHNHLNPGISKEIWSESEDRIIIESHLTLGNKWADIAKLIPARFKE